MGGNADDFTEEALSHVKSVEIIVIQRPSTKLSCIL